MATLAFLATATCAPDTSVARVRASFPGELAETASPSGRFGLRWIAGHKLLLCDRRAGLETELLAFPRGIEVLWSPQGTHLAISNHWASDEATVLLWTQLPGKPLDLLEELASHEKEGVARWGAHHLYLDACAWETETSVTLHLWGYGDPAHATIDRWYRYDLAKGFDRLADKRRSRTSGCS